MSRLKSQVGIVTGASSGIGESVAMACAKEGATVILASRTAVELERVSRKIAETGGATRVVPTDVTREDSVRELFARTRDELGRLDFLINNAGVVQGGATEELSLQDWRRVLDINLTGVFLCSREALKIMKDQGSGRIVNVGSISGKVPRPDNAAYSTSKFGVDGLSHSLALDARPHGIAVSVVHPGNTWTPMWKGKEEIAQREGAISSEDVAQVILTVLTLPPQVNLLESIVVPLTQPFLGRG